MDDFMDIPPEVLRKMWEDAMPKLKKGYKPIVYIVGTAGEIADSHNFKELFYNPEKYAETHSRQQGEKKETRDASTESGG